MRKHFLLLFLMTLLPLAGWAQIHVLQDSEVSISDFVYKGTIDALELPKPAVHVDGVGDLDLGTGFTWDGKYYSDAACTTEVTLRNVGTYYVKVVGVEGEGYGGSARTSFKVVAAQLTVAIKATDSDAGDNVAYIIKNYGEQNPNLTGTGIARYVRIIGLKTGDVAADVFDGTALGYTQTQSAANAAAGASVPLEGKTAYALTWTGLTPKTTNNNYEITWPSTKMLIQRIALTTSNLKVPTITNAPEEYTGEIQTEPTYTVKYQNGTALTTLTKGTDFTISYKVTIGAAEPADVTVVGGVPQIKNAGLYKAIFTGTGNYEGSVVFTGENAANKKYSFTMNPTELWIYPNAKTVNYKGAAYVVGDFTGATAFVYNYEGLKIGDSENYFTVTPAITGTAKNVGQYDITVSAVVAGGAPTATATNYTLKYESAKLTINPVTGLTFKASKATKVYGPIDPTTNPLTFLDDDGDETPNQFTVTGVKGGDAAATFAAAIRVVVNQEAKNANTYDNGVVISAFEGDLDPEDYADDAAYNAAVNALNAARTALANYTNPTWTNNELEITPATLRFTPKNISKVYGQEDPAYINSSTPSDADKVTVRGFVYDDAAATVITTWPTLSRVEGEDAGEYKLSVNDDAVLNSNYTAKPQTGKFNITKKALKVTANDQTFIAGTDYVFNGDAYSITTGYELVAGDEGKVFTIGFVDPVSTATTPGTEEGTFKFASVPTGAGWADGVYVGGIAISPYVGEGSKATNYDFETLSNFTAGKVIVVAAAGTVVLDDSNDLTSDTELQAHNGTEKHVTFTSRQLTGGKWNVLVLPFDIEVSDLSTALGYAVVDAFNTTKTDGNIHFDIFLNEIKANTPILVMPKANINLNAVTFLSKTIKYKKTGSGRPYTLNADNNPYVENAAAGVKFVGTYKAKSLWGPGYRYMAGGTFYGTTNLPETDPEIIKPLRAYLDLTEATSAAPMIIIQEPDGSTTAISTVNADNFVNNYTKDGWYTINGLKLDDMPTTKGVYIHNGKKVVIK